MKNLRILLSFSPVGKQFKIRCREVIRLSSTLPWWTAWRSLGSTSGTKPPCRTSLWKSSVIMTIWALESTTNIWRTCVCSFTSKWTSTASDIRNKKEGTPTSRPTVSWAWPNCTSDCSKCTKNCCLCRSRSTKWGWRRWTNPIKRWRSFRNKSRRSGPCFNSKLKRTRWFWLSWKWKIERLEKLE